MSWEGTATSSEDAVRELATGLGWDVAANLRGVVPISALASTMRHGLLHELVTGPQLDRAALKPGEDETPFYGIAPPVITMLTWLLQHYPDVGATVIAETIGDAERDLEIPRSVTADSIRTAVLLRPSTADDADLTKTIDKALAPILENRP